MTSVDLSSATDRFPFSIQSYLLDEAERFLMEDTDYLEDLVTRGKIQKHQQSELRNRNLSIFRMERKILTQVAKGDYLLPDALARRYGAAKIRWETGQPLGAYFSFALFSLAHHALVRAQQPIFYRILGDDLVLDSETARRHIGVLNDLNIPWSPEKSLMDRDACEFAGFIITPVGEVPQLKVKHTSDDNFVEQARALGPKSVKLFRPRQRRLLNVLDHVLPDIYPMGLGWNTKGARYEDRLVLSESFRLLQAEKEEVRISLDTRQLYAAVSNRTHYHRPRNQAKMAELLSEAARKWDPNVSKWTNFQVLIGGTGYRELQYPEKGYKSGPSLLVREEQKARLVDPGSYGFKL
jgi:hypothetical protein